MISIPTQHPLAYTKVVEIVGALQDALAPIEYRGRSPSKFLGVHLHHAVQNGIYAPASSRQTFLETSLGRLFRALRCRRSRQVLRAQPRGGTVVWPTAGHRGVLSKILPRVRSKFQKIAIRGEPPRASISFSHLVPGRRHPGIEAATRELYRQWRLGEGEVQELLPESSAWVEALMRQACHQLDAAEVYWSESQSPGAVFLSHMVLEDQALASLGREAGRRTLALHHGYLVEVLYWNPGCFDSFAVWDPRTAARVQAVSAGDCRPILVGHPHELPRLDPQRPRTGRILFASTITWRDWEDYYRPLARDLSSDSRWWVLRKQHPAEKEMGQSAREIGTRASLIEGRSLYSIFPEVDLVVGTVTGTGAEARLAGWPALCLAHPSETLMDAFATQTGIHRPYPGESPAEAVVRALAAPLEPPLWAGSIPPRSEAWVETLEAVFQGLPLARGRP